MKLHQLIIGKLLFILFLLLTMSYFSPSALAQEYKVKGYIFIPSNFKNIPGADDETTITKYKNGIIYYLQSVQNDLYAVLLKGKTYNIDSEVEVVYSENAIPVIQEGDLIQRFYYLDGNFGDNKFPFEEGVIKAIWVVGAKYSPNAAGFEMDNDFPQNPKAARIVIGYNALLALDEDRNSTTQKLALTVLAHELGHAFGAVQSGYAKWHPCTVWSPQECQPDAPQPYAGGIEWRSIMGYAKDVSSYPHLFFNNSTYNPELWKVYQSPFVNPNRDPPPTPEEDNNLKFPSVIALYPSTVNAGQYITIYGSRMEDYNVAITKQGTGELLTGTIIKRNIGSEMDVYIPDEAVPPGSQSIWNVKLANRGEFLDIPTPLTIRGKINEVLLTAKTTATCGSEKRVLPEVPILLTQNQTVLTRALTDEQGKAVVTFSVNNPKAGDKYNWEAAAIEGIFPSPGFTVEMPNPPGSSTVTLNFHYPKCPTFTAVPTPSPFSSLTPSAAEFSPQPSPSVFSKISTQTTTLVHGLSSGSFSLPEGFTKLAVGGRVFANDSSNTCVKGEVGFLLEKIKDAQGGEIFPRIFMDVSYVTVGEGNTEGETTEGEYLNCQSYWAKLAKDSSIAGTYRLSVNYYGDEQYQQSGSTLIFAIDSDNIVTLVSDSPNQVVYAPAPDTAGSPEDTPEPEISELPEPEQSPEDTAEPEASAVPDEGNRENPAQSPGPQESARPEVNRLYVKGEEVEVKNPDAQVNIRLEGEEGVEGEADLSVWVELSDGSSKDLVIRFKYVPEEENKPQELSPEGSLAPEKTIKGWYCADSTRMYVAYSDGTNEFNCTCGDETDDCRGGTVCENETSAPAPYEFDAKCVSPAPSPSPEESPTPEKTIKGWYCADEAHMYKVYSDGTNEFNCTCGDGSPDCSGGTICQDEPNVPAPYEFDAKCTFPDETAPSCQTSTQNFCIGCEMSAVVETGSCSGLGTLREQTDQSCDPGGVCGNPVSCPAPYTQCGGSTGLENQPSDHLFYITPLCDENGDIYEYRNTDVGRIENQCGN